MVFFPSLTQPLSTCICCLIFAEAARDFKTYTQIIHFRHG